MIIDLSPMMLARVKNYHHKLDRKLLSECAYYPRQGCKDCNWDAPNPDCRWSHILIDTRCGSSQPTVMRKRVKVAQKKGDTLWGVQIDKLMRGLPPFARKEIEEILGRLEVR
jgi:hypothetical protein